jgi:hypothetical protein
VLSDAELLLGLSRHLSAFGASVASTALANLEFSGQVYEMAWRLRGSQVSSAARIRAIALEAKIKPRELERDVLPALESLNLIEIARDPSDGSLRQVSEFIPPPAELIALAPAVIAITMPTPIELAALRILRGTSLQPLEATALASLVEDEDEVIAAEAARHLEALRLVRSASADERRVLFNPNIWSDEAVALAALKVEDARIRTEVGALLEEVAQSPGMPETAVSSTEQRWIDFAVAHGLVQRSVVTTSEGDEKRFLFTPHLGRDAFGVSPTDPSGHVRQLVGSMIYAATYAKIRLWSPVAFVRKLIREGEAGDASPIGTDYPMLETGGIVRVKPGSTSNKFALELLQADVAESALAVLESRGGSGDGGEGHAAGLRAQRSYEHVERQRARLAIDVPTDDADARRLIEALRDSTARRQFGV